MTEASKEMVDRTLDLCSGRSEITTKKRIGFKLRKLQSSAKLYLHAVWWRFLWATKLGKPYSRFLCRNGWYTEYRKGVCGYCGETRQTRGHQ